MMPVYCPCCAEQLDRDRDGRGTMIGGHWYRFTCWQCSTVFAVLRSSFDAYQAANPAEEPS